MSTLEGLATHRDAFSTDAHYMSRGIRLSVRGHADMRVRTVLSQVLRRLHEEALRSLSREVLIDFRLLEFMNSSCFKSFVTWVTSVQDLPEPQQYRIRVRANPSAHWQGRSLPALQGLAPDLVSLE